jgi:GntR family transcriptional regulator
MRIVIDRRSAAPVYVQLMRGIKEIVGRGQLPVGYRLPSVRQIAADLRINLNTAARAYRELAALGLLDVRRGRRAVVASTQSASDEAQRERVRQAAESLVAEAALACMGSAQLHELVETALNRLPPWGQAMPRSRHHAP